MDLLDGVDHTAVAARGENDEAASFEIVGRGKFMPELIGDIRLCLLVFRKLVGIAADPVFDADLHRARRKDLLEAPQCNLPCGEGVRPHE